MRSSLSQAFLLSGALAGCSDYNLMQESKDYATNDFDETDTVFTPTETGDTATESTDDTGGGEIPRYPFSQLLASCLNLDEAACPTNLEESSTDTACVGVAQERQTAMTTQIETAMRAALSDENITLNDVLNGTDVPATVYASYAFHQNNHNGEPAWSKYVYVHISFGDHFDEYQNAYFDADDTLWPFDTLPLDTVNCTASAHSYEVDQPKEDVELTYDQISDYFKSEDGSELTELGVDNFTDYSGNIYVYDEQFETADSNYIFDSTLNTLETSSEALFRAAWSMADEPTSNGSAVTQY